MERAEYRMASIGPGVAQVTRLLSSSTLPFLSFVSVWALTNPLHDRTPSATVAGVVTLMVMAVACVYLGKNGILTALSTLAMGAGTAILAIPRLASRVHELAWPYSAIMSAVGRLLGLISTSTTHEAQFFVGRGWTSISVSPGLLGIWPLLVLISACLPLWISQRRWGQVIARTAICTMIILPAVATIESLVLSDLGQKVLLLSPFESYFKMALCSVVLLPTTRETIDWSTVPRPRWQDVLLVLCGLTFILTSVNMVTIGNRRPVSVLIDDAHGHWEPIDTVMDKEHFGRMATYTYTNMVDIFSHYGSVKVSKTPITEELLDDVGVLILKTPSIRYSAEEIACITEFVHQGGGLLALGDHTNLIGMSTYLNEVLNPFGVSYEYDDLFLGATGSFSAWERRLSDINPLCATMPSRMRFETSCSIKAPLNAQDCS